MLPRNINKAWRFAKPSLATHALNDEIAKLHRRRLKNSARGAMRYASDERFIPEPKGTVAKQYGTYQEADGFCERALFVIDHKGLIFWNYLSPVAVNPGADGILHALEQ